MYVVVSSLHRPGPDHSSMASWRHSIAVLIIVGCHFAIPREMHPSTPLETCRLCSAVSACSAACSGLFGQSRAEVGSLPFQQRGDRLFHCSRCQPPSSMCVDLMLRSSIPANGITGGLLRAIVSHLFTCLLTYLLYMLGVLYITCKYYMSIHVCVCV